MVVAAPAKLGFVFSCIVAVVRGNGTPTRYTCEYQTEAGKQRLSHTRDQVSDAAVADFTEKTKCKLFQYDKEEMLQRKDMCGNNDKEFQEILRRRAQSAGVGAGITNCGVIVDLYELFGAESASQVRAALPRLHVLCSKIFSFFCVLAGVAELA